MIKSSVELMILGAASAVGFDLANGQQIVSTTIADWGVIAGIIIGGIGALAKAFEVGTSFWLKWLERKDLKKDQSN